MSDPDLYRRLARLEALVETLRTIDRPSGQPVAYTPTYFGGATAGVTTYTTQIGRWVRFGDVARVWGVVAWSAATGTGNARISLPFTHLNVSGFVSPVVVRLSTVTYAGDSFQAAIAPNTNYFQIEGITSNAGPTATAVEAAGTIAFATMYLTD